MTFFMPILPIMGNPWPEILLYADVIKLQKHVKKTQNSHTGPVTDEKSVHTHANCWQKSENNANNIYIYHIFLLRDIFSCFFQSHPWKKMSHPCCQRHVVFPGIRHEMTKFPWQPYCRCLVKVNKEGKPTFVRFVDFDQIISDCSSTLNTQTQTVSVSPLYF